MFYKHCPTPHVQTFTRFWTPPHTFCLGLDPFSSCWSVGYAHCRFSYLTNTTWSAIRMSGGVVPFVSLDHTLPRRALPAWFTADTRANDAVWAGKHAASMAAAAAQATAPGGRVNNNFWAFGVWLRSGTFVEGLRSPFSSAPSHTVGQTFVLLFLLRASRASCLFTDRASAPTAITRSSARARQTSTGWIYCRARAATHS